MMYNQHVCASTNLYLWMSQLNMVAHFPVFTASNNLEVFHVALCICCTHGVCVCMCVREWKQGRQRCFMDKKSLFINVWPNPFKSVFAVWVKTHYRFSQWWSNKKILQQWCNAHTKIAPTVISSVPLYPSVLPFIFFHFGHVSVWATVGQTLIVHQWHQERISKFFYCECKYPRSPPKMADQLKKQQKNCL